MYWPLIATAAILAVIYGVNAGGTMVAIGFGIGAFHPLLAVVGLGAAVAVMPALVGTAVATTLSSQLVTMPDSNFQLLTLEASVAAILVVGVLGVLGIPTSLTLALVGGLTGVSLGAGDSVAWSRVGVVFATLAAAPIVGAAVANQLSRMLRLLRTGTSPIRRRLVRLHVVAFAGLALAFGAGDAQKLLAVMAIGVSGAQDSVQPTMWVLALLGLLFAVGSAIGMRTMARSTSAGAIALRPLDAVVAQGATATVMLAGAAIGSPAGMAQTLSGSLIGVGLNKGIGSIRWDYAGRILGVWALTLPSALAVSLALGLLTRLLGG